MNKINFLLCSNDKKEEFIDSINSFNKNLNLALILKDYSSFTINKNVENFFELINDIQYFNTLILNYSKKEDIFLFFKSFNSEEIGISNECYPFFMISKNLVSKSEMKNFIHKLNESKEDDYKFNLGKFIFFNEINGKEFQYILLDIYNCYCQDSKKLKGEEDNIETLNILLIGVKNSGKSYLINRLLGETRALSMENHYTTKLNSYKHKKYPIVFYDICGFNNNEDQQIKNIKSKIEEFNKDYKILKNKIHVIFYVIDCNSVRILQNKEKQLIEDIFEINIPIFIIGQKAKITNIKNFIRKTQFQLTTFAKNYKEKIDILNTRIFCLDSTKDSYINLLEAVYDELIESKKINDEILDTYTILDSEELLNNSFSENFNIKQYNDERNSILILYQKMKKSIFFNIYIEKIKEVYKKITLIKDKYINKNYYFESLNTKEFCDEIENEFRKIFSHEDLEKIYKLIKDHQNDLNEKEKEMFELKYYYAIPAIISGITIPYALFISPIAWGAIGLISIVDAALLNKRDNKTKSIITENIENLYSKFNWKYLLINLIIIKNKAEIYNRIIDEFDKFISDFKNNDLI